MNMLIPRTEAELARLTLWKAWELAVETYPDNARARSHFVTGFLQSALSEWETRETLYVHAPRLLGMV